MRATVRAHADWDHHTVVGLAAELWCRLTHEMRRSAVELLVMYEQQLTGADLAPVERRARHVAQRPRDP